MKIRDIILEESHNAVDDDLETMIRDSEREYLAGQKSEFSTVVTLLKTHCQPYLSEVGGINNALFNQPIYRGIPGVKMGVSYDNPIGKVSVRNDRQPKDTPSVIHQRIDTWFQQHYGYRYRSAGLFCAGSESVASMYGTPYVVVPIGEFHYCWSPTYGDLFNELENSAHVLWRTHTQSIPEISKSTLINVFSVDSLLDEFLINGHYRCDKGLNDAITATNTEIMIICREAYILNLPWIRDIYSRIIRGKFDEN